MVNYDYLYNKEYYGDKLYKEHFSDKKLHFKIIENGTVLPHRNLTVNGQWSWGVGGVVDDNNEFIPSSFVHNGVGDAYTPNEEIKYSPETVIYSGMFSNTWGHGITDNIRRFWFFKSDAYKKYFQKCKTIYTLCRGGFNK